MIVYFIRHGETEWNKKKIVQGHKDSPLTLKGKKIAEKLGEILKSKNIEVIYTSDLGRCVQTAEIINRYLKVKLIKVKKLRERNFGSLNGKPAKRVKREINLSDLNKVAPKGESFSQLKNRVIHFIKLLAKKKLERVLLIIHEGTARVILSDYHDVDFNSKKCNTRSDKIYKIIK